MKKESIQRTVAAGVLALFSVVSNAAAVYSALDLGPLAIATGLNDKGQVAGYYLHAGPASAPTLGFTTGADGQGITLLGTLGGASSQAFDINNAGRAVGMSNPGGPYPYSSGQHAFMTGTDGATLTDLGLLPTAGPSAAAYAYAVNGSGQAVGYSYINGYDFIRAFITGANGSGMSALGSLNPNGRSIAYGINDQAQVVGDSDVFTGPGWALHAFITGGNAAGMTDLGTLGGSNSHASDINSSGQVVGYSLLSNNLTQRAYVTGSNGAGMTDLGSLGGISGSSQALGIDDAGDVVGWSDVTGNGKQAFLRLSGGTMVNLNDLVVGGLDSTLTEAVDINARGQIIANSIGGHAYLLTRTAFTVPNSIPEPATSLLVILALGLGLLRSGRRSS